MRGEAAVEVHAGGLRPQDVHRVAAAGPAGLPGDGPAAGAGWRRARGAGDHPGGGRPGDGRVPAAGRPVAQSKVAPSTDLGSRRTGVFAQPFPFVKCAHSRPDKDVSARKKLARLCKERKAGFRARRHASSAHAALITRQKGSVATICTVSYGLCHRLGRSCLDNLASRSVASLIAGVRSEIRTDLDLSCSGTSWIPDQLECFCLVKAEFASWDG